MIYFDIIEIKDLIKQSIKMILLIVKQISII